MFNSLPAEIVQNWDELMRAFMAEHYSPAKIWNLRSKNATFSQYSTETIAEVYERFKDYVRAVPHHKFPKEDLV